MYKVKMCRLLVVVFGLMTIATLGTANASRLNIEACPNRTFHVEDSRSNQARHTNHSWSFSLGTIDFNGVDKRDAHLVTMTCTIRTGNGRPFVTYEVGSRLLIDSGSINCGGRNAFF